MDVKSLLLRAEGELDNDYINRKTTAF